MTRSSPHMVLRLLCAVVWPPSTEGEVMFRPEILKEHPLLQFSLSVISSRDRCWEERTCAVRSAIRGGLSIKTFMSCGFIVVFSIFFVRFDVPSWFCCTLLVFSSILSLIFLFLWNAIHRNFYTTWFCFTLFQYFRIPDVSLSFSLTTLLFPSPCFCHSQRAP